MGRKRKDLGPGADDRIVAMMAKGSGPDAVATEIGTSRATAARRMKELRPQAQVVRVAKRAIAKVVPGSTPSTSPDKPVLSSTPGASPAVNVLPSGLAPDSRAAARAALLAADESTLEQTPLEQIGEWLKMAREEVDIARRSDDLDMLQKMTRLAATLLTLQQKHTPIEPPDPNANPDFVAAASRVRERWHETLNKAALAKALIAMGEAIRRR